MSLLLDKWVSSSLWSWIKLERLSVAFYNFQTGVFAAAPSKYKIRKKRFSSRNLVYTVQYWSEGHYCIDKWASQSSWVDKTVLVWWRNENKWLITLCNIYIFCSKIQEITKRINFWKANNIRKQSSVIFYSGTFNFHW